ncbi:MAG: hypothetical protein IJW73_02740 [Candidatus Gastranaerophilales bacterium]|nr:hypothetical protein [Candidatus Gastranaerophilales bacterium]
MINTPSLELVKPNTQAQQGSVSTTQTAPQESASLFETAKTEITSWLNDTDKTWEDEADDGKLGFKEAAEHFGKGLLGIVKTAINHPVKTGLAIAAGVGAVAAFPVLGPILCAGGMVCGAATIGKGIYDYAKAENDADAKQAFETMGNGAFALGSGVLGSKAALKHAGINGTEEMTIGQAAKGCFDYTKMAAKEIANGGITGGAYIDANNTAHLTSKIKVSKQMDDLVDSGMPDLGENINSQTASEYLKFFGKYGEGVKLNPENNYSFLQAHGSMQLYDKTANQNLITTYESLSNPLKQVLAWNINNK